MKFSINKNKNNKLKILRIKINKVKCFTNNLGHVKIAKAEEKIW